MSDLLEMLTPYVGRLCGPIALDDGPDATQETLLAIYRQLGSLREPAALYGWVRTIAIREAVRVARRTRRARSIDLTEIPASDAPELPIDIEAVLRGLSPEHRAVLMLRDLEGFDEQAAARLLAVPEATVRTRLFRARRAFRKAWIR